MIIIPIEKSLGMAQRIKNSNPTKKQIKRARDASIVGTLHIKNMSKPVIVAIQPWNSVLPFGLDIPILPYV